MAAIEDLLKQIADPRLRDRIAQEWEQATRHKKFGLVFEQHLPEVVPIYSAKPRRGDLVAKRNGTLSETWRIRRVANGMASLVKPKAAGDKESTADRVILPLDDLLVVKQFGEPIFPTLVPMDTVQNGPADAPWHTLIEADNYHALQLLEYLYAGQVDCIYIDPPYNTGAKDWKYNNNYVDSNDGWRHSKWLSFMEKRLRLAKKLLKPDTGVLICTIDEHEVHHLGSLLAEIFPEFYRQMVTIVINPKGVTQGRFSRVEEFAFFVFATSAFVRGVGDDLLSYHNTVARGVRWKGLLRSGTNARRKDRKGMFYPVLIDIERGAVVGTGDILEYGIEPELGKLCGNIIEAWPVRMDGSLGNWGVGKATLNKLIEKGYVSAGGFDPIRQTYAISYLSAKPQKLIETGGLVIDSFDAIKNRVSVVYAEEKERQIKSVWHRTLHDAGAYGSDVVRKILGDGSFTFPKSIYAVRDSLLSVLRTKRDALTIDFFAGSGTTLSAVHLLNHLDEGNRRCILVTNNEVSAEEADVLRDQGYGPGDTTWDNRGICRSVTWPRTKFTVAGQRDDGTPLAGEYLTGRTVEREKRRTFRHAAFLSPEALRPSDGLSAKDRAKALSKIHKSKLALVSMIDGLPQTLVTPGSDYIVSEDHKASVLFDPAALDPWLEALDGNDHITDFFIVADSDRQFKAIKAQVEDLLGPLLVPEEEKRPMSAGFPANVAFFRLDFLEKDRVELGAAFREIVPLLWMKAASIGPVPVLPAGDLPDYLIPPDCPFAVLLNETRIVAFCDALAGRSGLTLVFIVTDAEDAFRMLANELRSHVLAENPNVEFVQLYRDYLVNFTINTRTADTALGAEGVA